MQQLAGPGRGLPQAAAVQLPGDADRVPRVAAALRREHRRSTRGRPGTMSAPGPAATSTRRRTRLDGQRQLLREPAATRCPGRRPADAERASSPASSSASVARW